MRGALTLQGWRKGTWEEKGSRRKGKTITGSQVPPAKADAVGWGLRRWAEMEEGRAQMVSVELGSMEVPGDPGQRGL